MHTGGLHQTPRRRTNYIIGNNKQAVPYMIERLHPIIFSITIYKYSNLNKITVFQRYDISTTFYTSNQQFYIVWDSYVIKHWSVVIIAILLYYLGYKSET